MTRNAYRQTYAELAQLWAREVPGRIFVNGKSGSAALYSPGITAVLLGYMPEFDVLNLWRYLMRHPAIQVFIARRITPKRTRAILRRIGIRFSNLTTEPEILAEGAMTPIKGTRSGEPLFPEGLARTLGVKVLKSIGSGAFGSVWLVRQPGFGFVVVKIVADKRSRLIEEEALKHYLQALKAASGGLLPIWGYRIWKGCLVYMMPAADCLRQGTKIVPDLYEPKTLAAILKTVGQREAVGVIIALLKQLVALHNHGLVHSDLKPANIVYVDGEPRFVDISLLRPINHPLVNEGTQPWRAPEGGGKPSGDIYSLGMMLYEMITGLDSRQLPDFFDEEASLRVEHLELRAIIQQACAYNFRDRYQRAEDMLHDLERIDPKTL